MLSNIQKEAIYTAFFLYTHTKPVQQTRTGSLGSGFSFSHVRNRDRKPFLTCATSIA